MRLCVRILLKVNTCPRESKAHVVVKSSCKFGNNGFLFLFLFFGKEIYIYIYGGFCVCVSFFFLSFFCRGGEGSGWVGGSVMHTAARRRKGALGRRGALSTMQLGK